MNHVPDEAVTAIENFGEGLLFDDPRPVRERLRSDLRLRIPCDAAAVAAGETTVEFRIEHTRTEPTLRAYGSFVETVVDGVETVLREWGVTLPEQYEYTKSADGEHRYTGTIIL